jgi:hypothetical protein
MGRACAASDEMALHSRCSLNLVLADWGCRPPVGVRRSTLGVINFFSESSHRNLPD